MEGQAVIVRISRFAARHNRAEPIGGETTWRTATVGGNQINVPQAKDALNNMKYEIARELGVNLKQGYNGDLTSREAGYVGGYMVKRLIEQAEHQMAGQDWVTPPIARRKSGAQSPCRKRKEL